jgi:ribosomal protein S13
MNLRDIIRKGILKEGGNVSNQSPGWQGVDGDHQAQELDLQVHNRAYVQDVVSDTLTAINNVFAQQFKEPLWHENSVKTQKFLSGSTFQFMDKKIPDAEFVRVKPKVGDIDTQAPDKHADTIKQFLQNNLGKLFGNAKLLGYTPGNSQWVSLWEIKLKDLPVKVQIDFEYGAHDAESGLPTDWQSYSHSSSWDDLSQNIKGVFHKYLDRALPYTQASTKYVARVLKKSTKISDAPVTDSDYSFAVSGPGGGGVSRKYIPYNDPSTGQPMEKDGVPVMQLLEPSSRQYIQNLKQQFEIFFGRKPTAQDQQLKNSFVGTVTLASKYLDDQARTELFNRFVSICFEPGSQMITKDDPTRDRDTKFAAIDWMVEHLKLPNAKAARKQAIDTAMAYEQAFNNKKAAKQPAPVNEGLDPFRSLLMALRQDAGQFVDTKGAMGGQRFLLNVNQRLAQLQQTGNPRSKVVADTVKDMISDATRSAGATKGLSFGTLASTLLQLTQHELKKVDQQPAAVNEAEEKPAVLAQLRKGMPHLRDLKPADFLDLVDEMRSEGGRFKLQNIPLNVKIDGFGGRFGKNADGKPFMGTSNTEPRYQAGFVAYHQQKGTTDPEILGRAANFDKLFNEVMNAIKAVDARLGADFLVDKQVTCEVLFLPFATKTDEGRLKFVGIEYDQLPEGVDLVLVPFRVVEASTGKDLPNADEIVSALTELGHNGSVAFMSNKLAQKEALDVTEIINVLDNIDELKSIVSSTAGKRDRASVQLRREVEEKLKPVQIELERAIDEDPNIVGKDLLGQDYEGIVINSRLGPVKVTSQKQKDIIKAKNAAKVNARTERPRENTNKTAVVAIGSFVGHVGHEQLFDYTVKKAAQVGGDPYLFIGNAQGKDDPIPPSVKVQTWHKMYPQYAKNISTVTQEGGSLLQKIKHELINPLPGKPPRYDNVIIMVGEDQAKLPMAQALMKAVNKFPGYEHVKASLEVTPRGTGMSFTKLRNILKDPNATPEQQLQVWSQGFDVKKLGVDWIKHLMDITRKGMGVQNKVPTPVKQPPERLSNALIRPKQPAVQEPEQLAEDEDVWQTVNQVAKANNITNPNLIRPGQQIKLPNGQTYIVKAGDTLGQIVQKNQQQVGAGAGRGNINPSTAPQADTNPNGSTTWKDSSGRPVTSSDGTPVTTTPTNPPVAKPPAQQPPVAKPPAQQPPASTVKPGPNPNIDDPTRQRAQTFVDQQGSVIIGNEKRAGGTVSWRTNNPGNVSYGDMAKQHGAVGTWKKADGDKQQRTTGIAIMPTLDAGINLQMSLWRRPLYNNRSIVSAVNMWTKGIESNNPTTYASDLAKAAGVDVNAKVADLSDDQLRNLVKKQAHWEGWRPGQVAQVSNPQQAVAESPIEMDPAEPMNPTIYGHQGVNPAELKTRMMRAKGQLTDLAQRAQNASPLEWESIARHFSELAMNIEQIRHALDELAKIRKRGGIKSRGIDPNIGEGLKGAIAGGAVSALAGPEAIPIGMEIGDKLGDLVSRHRNEKNKEKDVAEELDRSKRIQIIRFLAKTMGWGISDLELAKDSELVYMYKKVKSGEHPVEEAGSPAQQAAIAIAKKKEQGVAEGSANSIDLLKQLEAMIKNFVQTRGQMGGQRLSVGILPILNNLEQLGEKGIAQGIKSMVLDARNKEQTTKGASWSVFAQGLSQKLPELIRTRMQSAQQPARPAPGVAEGSLEEVDRRGFLKGIGAAAIAGAAGGAIASQPSPALKAEMDKIIKAIDVGNIAQMCFHTDFAMFIATKEGNKEMYDILKRNYDKFCKGKKFEGQGVAEVKQRLDPSCWKGYKKSGTKMKGDTRVNNCVPVSEDVENIMAVLIDRLIVNEAIQNNKRRS